MIKNISLFYHLTHIYRLINIFICYPKDRLFYMIFLKTIEIKRHTTKVKNIQWWSSYNLWKFYFIVALISSVLYVEMSFKIKWHQLTGFINMIINGFIEVQTGEGKTIILVLLSTFLSMFKFKIHYVTSNKFLSIWDYHIFYKFYKYFFFFVDCLEGRNYTKFNDKLHYYYQNNILYATMDTLMFDFIFSMYYEGCYTIRWNVIIIDEVDQELIDKVSPWITSTKIISSDDFTFLTYPIKYIIPHLIRNVHYSILLDRSVYIYSNVFWTIYKLAIWFLKKNTLKFNKYFIWYKLHYVYFLNSFIKKIIYAKFFLKKNIDYTVKDNKIILISRLSGRMKSSSKLTSLLHQAIEYIEGVTFSNISSSTFSIYVTQFILFYDSIYGTSGTLKQVAHLIKYRLNKDVSFIKREYKWKLYHIGDFFFNNYIEKNIFLINFLQKKIINPIIIFTTNLKMSFFVSRLLSKNHIKHNIIVPNLSLKHEKQIIYKAGYAYNITIVNNMSGWGIDVKLGQDEEERQRILQHHGLIVILYEHNWNQRLDLQAIGRTSRWNNPGMYLTLNSINDVLFNEFDRMNMYWFYHDGMYHIDTLQWELVEIEALWSDNSFSYFSLSIIYIKIVSKCLLLLKKDLISIVSFFKCTRSFLSYQDPYYTRIFKMIHSVLYVKVMYAYVYKNIKKLIIKHWWYFFINYLLIRHLTSLHYFKWSNDFYHQLKIKIKTIFINNFMIPLSKDIYHMFIKIYRL